MIDSLTLVALNYRNNYDIENKIKYLGVINILGVVDNYVYNVST